jgi:hypothetical protein
MTQKNGQRSRAASARGPAPSARRDDAPVRGARSLAARPLAPQTVTQKAEEAMAERLESLQPGTKRYDVLVAAIDFKRSWVDLARNLAEVQRAGLFKEWGYRTFEAFAQHELHLRRETAQKLVRSFDFLAEHEAPALEAAQADESRAMPLPSFQALDVLAEARANPYLAEDDYKEIRDQVFEEDPPPAQVRKLVKERAPEPKKAVQEDAQARLRKCLALAERLYGMLLEEEGTDAIARQVEAAVGGLRRLLDDE